MARPKTGGRIQHIDITYLVIKFTPFRNLEQLAKAHGLSYRSIKCGWWTGKALRVMLGYGLDLKKIRDDKERSISKAKKELKEIEDIEVNK
ncbi:hypothetical protein [Campylobacter hyointestinalis]|uniref:Uncharacterized protein n=1 Tax=Campylobacter hyointestinalis subsp. hyointestinalis TaxID=91352 RepID=A0A9W5APA8_CAMHY|nr:hypothetical protein [Campylobacter hyointestinalis]CUU74040.1 Uncharacterised protein [Campylobacter hyointestinalis subsp. hyointestinalis]CUU81860.1 Uncharacterised protein [Campylobacter hyointestinalis subsp. hyointestinalis]